MILLRGMDGQDYRTEGELARGGEGIIYTLQGRADLLVKLYLPAERKAEREVKLRAMIADPPRDEMREHLRHVSITWPLTLLHEKGRFAGYLMPRIHGGRSLLNAYNHRARDSLRFDWHAQHQVAKNLCTALHALHVKGYLMGDLNQRNILVTDQGLVTLVDTDSFQVRVGATVHRCIVGTPEYTPRELQGQRFDQVDRAPEHDRFGLAVLVFQLLMDGFHPFAGALTDPNDSVEGKADEWCIRNGIFPWRDNRRFRRPPAARPLETLDAGLQELFLRCFVSGHTEPFLRPSPKEWLDALNLAQQRLVRCNAGTHWRYPEGGPCHTCQTQQRQASQERSRIPPQVPVQSPPAALQTGSPIPPPQGRVMSTMRLRWTPAQMLATFGILAVLLLVLYDRLDVGTSPEVNPVSTVVTSPEVNPVSTVVPCTKVFCGVWEYRTGYSNRDKSFFRIKKDVSGKFKFEEGYENDDELHWMNTLADNAEGIYLTYSNGKLHGEFESDNFRPTHAQSFTYKITLAIMDSNKLFYHVYSSIRGGEYKLNEATRWRKRKRQAPDQMWDEMKKNIPRQYLDNQERQVIEISNAVIGFALKKLGREMISQEFFATSRNFACG